MPAGHLQDACPSCGAAVRSEAQWCTLCFTVLREPEVAKPAAAPEPAPVAPAAPLDPLTSPLAFVTEPHAAPGSAVPHESVARTAEGAQAQWPCTICHAESPVEAATCIHCGSAFLAAAAANLAVRLPLIGDITRLTRTQRALAALGVVIALLVPLALITYLISGDPAPIAPTDSGVQVVQAP